MFKKIFFILAISVFVIMPAVSVFALPTGPVPNTSWANDPTSAASLDCSPIKDFSQLVACAIQIVIQPLVAVLIGLAVLLFLWGVLTYIRNLDNETKRKEGGMMMFYGIIAIFVMVSVWGLVKVLTNTFMLDNANYPPIPTFPTSMTIPLVERVV